MPTTTTIGRAPGPTETHALQPGVYFITICTHEYACLFGDITAGMMRLGPYGQIVDSLWKRLADPLSYIQLDAFVVMPNHLHGLIVWGGTTPAMGTAGTPVGYAEPTLLSEALPVTRLRTPTLPDRPSNALGSLIHQFKSTTARAINGMRDTSGNPVWQRGYYEHIVRDARTLRCIRRYIAEHPRRWHLDRYGC